MEKIGHQTHLSSSSAPSAISPHSFEGTAASSIDNNNGTEKTKMINQENITTRQPPPLRIRQSVRSNRGVPSASMTNQDEILQQLIIDVASSSPSSSTPTTATNKKRLRDQRGEQENENEEETPAAEEEEEEEYEGEENERKKAKKHVSSMISKTGSSLGKRSRTSNTCTAPARANDHSLMIIRNRLTNGLLKVIRQQLHGPPPSGKKPYSKNEEGMNEKTALQLMNGYDDYQTSNTKKSIRWLLYDQDKIAELLSLPNNNNIISNVPYGGWVLVCKGEPTPSILEDAEFEALEVRYDRERNLFVLTSRTRLYYNENDAYYKWPVPKKLHFNPPH